MKFKSLIAGIPDSCLVAGRVSGDSRVLKTTIKKIILFAVNEREK